MEKQQLKDGSTLYIFAYGGNIGQKPKYQGRLTLPNGEEMRVSYTDDEYYNLLKNNGLKIPKQLLRESDKGFETKDNVNLDDQDEHYKKYILKNGDILHISGSCMESYPCQHSGVLNGKKWHESGDEIYKLLKENGFSDKHFDEYANFN